MKSCIIFRTPLNKYIKALLIFRASQFKTGLIRDFSFQLVLALPVAVPGGINTAGLMDTAQPVPAPELRPVLVSLYSLLLSQILTLATVASSQHP